MKLPDKSNRSMRDNMVPLINVVFLLIIFFMLVGTMETTPPFSVIAPQTLQNTESNKKDPVVFLTSDGKVAMSGGIMGEQQVLAKIGSLECSKNSIGILIQADQRTSYSALNSLISKLKSIGCQRISLLAAAESV